MSEQKNRNSSSTKCKNCGGSMIFSPAEQVLKCIQCGSSIAFESDKKPTKKLFDKIEEEKQTWDKESFLVRCQNCGAKEVVNSKNIAHKCSFCGSSKVTNTDETIGVKPGAIIPFNITQQSATINFTKWLKKKWFTPNDLKKTAKINDFGGVYTPTWDYDTNTTTLYNGILERRQTRVVNQKTQIVYVPVHVNGTISNNFRDLLMPVGQKIGRNMFSKLEPFKMNTLKIYDTNYLAGFVANHYSVNATEAWKSTTQVIKSIVTSNIVRKHGADRVRHLNMFTSYSNTKYLYTLLPIWVCNYYYKQKLFNFFINGNTGKVAGKVPRSIFKITLFILALLSIAIILTVIFGEA